MARIISLVGSMPYGVFIDDRRIRKILASSIQGYKGEEIVPCSSARQASELVATIYLLSCAIYARDPGLNSYVGWIREAWPTS